jgi:hypothetical protein
VDDNGFYTTTKNLVLNNNILTEKQKNDLQNIPLKKGDIVTSNDYNDDYITYENPNPLKYHPEYLQFWKSIPI